MSKTLSPRELVTNRLVRRVRTFPDLEIAPIVTDGLSGRDASLAWAIDQAVARRWLTLVAILQTHLERPWEKIESGAQAALLAGAAQLVLMDRLPAYAVISEAVNWTKRRVRPKAGGLINAVLRRVADMVEAAEMREGSPGELSRRAMPMEDGRVLVFGRDVFAEDELERLAQQTSHGIELLRKWHERFGMEETARLAMHDVVHPPTLMTGVSPEAETYVSESGEKLLTPHLSPGFFVFHGNHADLTLLLGTGPGARVQDPTAAAAVTLTNERSPKVVIDLCAGRGTKTRQLALAHPEAMIVASDASQERVRVLRSVFAEHERVKVVAADALGEYDGKADVVLCDVPCSNTGVLARRSEAKYRYSAAHTRDLVKMQWSIVSRAVDLLGPNGAIVYSTCSIEEEENAQQVNAAAKRHGLAVRQAVGTMPAGQPGEHASAYHDGGFAALLTRENDASG